MASKVENSSCAISIIGFVIGTVLFNVIYTDKVWDRVLNAPVSAMAATSSICLWLVMCIACSWLIGRLWSSTKK